MTTILSRDTVLKALAKIADPERGVDVVSARRVSGVVVRGGNVGFLIEATAASAEKLEPLRRECEGVVASLPGVERVTAVLSGETAAAPPAPVKPPETAAQWNRTPVQGVRHVIAVASGKGGVGKSTAAICLARALAQEGLRAGLLDADIYGPSVPLMMGLAAGQPETRNGRMLPPVKDGIPCMSMGLILGRDAAVMRAPMITKALSQMLRGVEWGELDALVVDMPPGTGDVHLSLAQQAPLSGAIVVTTPQQAATIDAHKAVQAFRKLHIPVWGIIENMSYMLNPATGAKLHPFGEGGGKRLAEETGTPFLGEMPLEPTLGAALDAGEMPEIPTVFGEVAASLIKQHFSPSGRE